MPGKPFSDSDRELVAEIRARAADMVGPPGDMNRPALLKNWTSTVDFIAAYIRDGRRP